MLFIGPAFVCIDIKKSHATTVPIMLYAILQAFHKAWHCNIIFVVPGLIECVVHVLYAYTDLCWCSCRVSENCDRPGSPAAASTEENHCDDNGEPLGREELLYQLVITISSVLWLGNVF